MKDGEILRKVNLRTAVRTGEETLLQYAPFLEEDGVSFLVAFGDRAVLGDDDVVHEEALVEQVEQLGRRLLDRHSRTAGVQEYDGQHGHLVARVLPEIIADCRLVICSITTVMFSARLLTTILSTNINI